jgi:cytohesin
MQTVLYLMVVGLALVPAVVRGDEIHEGAKAGDVAKVKRLLATDPDLVNATDAKPWVWTPLHHAADRGDDEMVELLLDRGARIDATDRSDETPLHLAVFSGHRRTAGLLLSRGANVNARYGLDRATALHFATKGGNVPMVELLICHGANVNARSRDDDSPLGCALYRNHAAVADMRRRAGARE